MQKPKPILLHTLQEIETFIREYKINYQGKPSGIFQGDWKKSLYQDLVVSLKDHNTYLAIEKKPKYFTPNTALTDALIYYDTHKKLPPFLRKIDQGLPILTASQGTLFSLSLRQSLRDQIFLAFSDHQKREALKPLTHNPKLINKFIYEYSDFYDPFLKQSFTIEETALNNAILSLSLIHASKEDAMAKKVNEKLKEYRSYHRLWLISDLLEILLYIMQAMLFYLLTIATVFLINKIAFALYNEHKPFSLNIIKPSLITIFFTSLLDLEWVHILPFLETEIFEWLFLSGFFITSMAFNKTSTQLTERNFSTRLFGSLANTSLLSFVYGITKNSLISAHRIKHSITEIQNTDVMLTQLEQTLAVDNSSLDHESDQYKGLSSFSLG